MNLAILNKEEYAFLTAPCASDALAREEEAAHEEDRRRHCRKYAMVSASVCASNGAEIVCAEGSVLDISFGGICLLTSDPKVSRMLTSDKVQAVLQIDLRLSSSDPVLSFTCLPSRIKDLGHSVLIGASLKDAPLNALQALHQYLTRP